MDCLDAFIGRCERLVDELGLSENVLESFPHDGWIGVYASPVTNADYALVDEHAEAVDHFASLRPSVLDEIGGGRVGDYVGDHHAFAKAVDVQVEPIGVERVQGEPEVEGRESRRPRAST